MILEKEQIEWHTGNRFASCPKQWQNFIGHIMDLHPNWQDTTNDEACNIINEHLKEFHAIRNDNTNTVVFESAAHKTWFLLKWG